MYQEVRDDGVLMCVYSDVAGEGGGWDLTVEDIYDAMEHGLELVVSALVVTVVEATADHGIVVLVDTGSISGTHSKMGHGGVWSHHWSGEGEVGVKGFEEDAVSLDAKYVWQGNDELGVEGVKIEKDKTFAFAIYVCSGVVTFCWVAAHPLLKEGDPLRFHLDRQLLCH